MELKDIGIGQKVTLTGEIRAADMSNGRDPDHPLFKMLPTGQLRVTLLINLADQVSS